MSEKEHIQIFTLEQVAQSIEKTIRNRYGSRYWIKAEMNKLNHYPHTGHCFPELLEKRGDVVVAEMRALLWKTDFDRINQRFLEVVKEPLKDGITVLLLASVQFDPRYGLSLHIHDIDPSFALGQLEAEKTACMNRLKKEGIYTANKERSFPLIPKRLAIISVESSKGYADFLKIIEQNPWGYHFEYKLFPAILQGERSVSSIVRQLEHIHTMASKFDVVLVIRGGGGEVGLASYNHYALASTIAKFPIPIMTGIGHSTNETVSEMVAYRAAITPSELADFLIQHFHQVAEPLQRAQHVLKDRVPEMIQQQRLLIEKLAGDIQLSVSHALRKHNETLIHHKWIIRSSALSLIQSANQQIQEVNRQLRQGQKTMLHQQRTSLEHIARQVRLLDPMLVLKRGFSITFSKKGKAVLHPDELNEADIIHTQLAGGVIESTVLGSDQMTNKKTK